jgi:parallel beta-helix repeat protein
MITFANNIAGPNEIVFDVTGTIATDSQLPTITEELMITGPGPGAPGLIIDAQLNSRVLNFSASSGDLTLVGLTHSGGRTTGENDSGETTHSGGGIRFNSSGTLALISSTASGNSTAGFRAYGGGIWTLSGDVSLTNSTVSGNSTTAMFTNGGGIWINTGDVTLTNSTVSDNSAAGFNLLGSKSPPLAAFRNI